MVNWPAIIKHADDAELIYVRDQSEWDGDAELHDFAYDDADTLIDSSGSIYSLTSIQNNQVKPELRGESIALQDLLGMVKAHAAQQGSCCVAKLYAPTITEAFKIVASLNET